jgi:hypothetical protein
MDNKEKILLFLRKYPEKNIYDLMEELGIAPLWFGVYYFTDSYFKKEFHRILGHSQGITNI